MNQPLLSIVIVTFNAGKHLRSCFENIIAQERNDIQLIIIDGKSTDDTLQIINEYKEEIDFWISEKDKGIYDAMNKSIKYIKGKWVFFMGADDLLEAGFKDMLSELVNPRAIYYGIVNVNNVLYKDPYSAYRLSKLNICHQAIFYPSSVFRRYQYDLKYPLWADWFLNIQCWADKNFKFIYKPHLISKFGLLGASSISDDIAFKQNHKHIILKYLGVVAWLGYSIRELKKKRYSNK